MLTHRSKWCCVGGVVWRGLRQAARPQGVRAALSDPPSKDGCKDTLSWRLVWRSGSCSGPPRKPVQPADLRSFCLTAPPSGTASHRSGRRLLVPCLSENVLACSRILILFPCGCSHWRLRRTRQQGPSSAPLPLPGPGFQQRGRLRLGQWPGGRQERSRDEEQCSRPLGASV